MSRYEINSLLYRLKKDPEFRARHCCIPGGDCPGERILHCEDAGLYAIYPLPLITTSRSGDAIDLVVPFVASTWQPYNTVLFRTTVRVSSNRIIQSTFRMISMVATRETAVARLRLAHVLIAAEARNGTPWPLPRRPQIAVNFRQRPSRHPCAALSRDQCRQSLTARSCGSRRTRAGT